MHMKDPLENPVMISREPLQSSMNQKTSSQMVLKKDDCLEDIKNIISRRKGRRRCRGPKVEKLQEAKLDHAGVGSPAPFKSLMLHRRPGYGQLGTKCLVKANHFLAEIPGSDICQYSVSFVKSPLIPKV
jgi:eukaryotic translation initiation factor 2C